MEPERLLSLAQAAAQRNISAVQLRLLAKQKKLWAIKIGRNWVTTLEAVDTYLASPGLRSRDPYKNSRR